MIAAITPDIEPRFTIPENWTWGIMQNAAGKNLRYGGVLPPQKPLAHIIYVEGLSEFAEKTFETARDMTAQGYSFWVVDRQGQGLSPRHLKDQFRQHARPFENDAADLARLATDILPRDGAPVFLLAHSTGGLISLIALHDHPQVFSGMVALAPPLALKDPIMCGREELAAALLLPEYLRQLYIVNGGPWRARSDPASRQPSALYSGDPVRQHIHDHWMTANPELRIGSPTVGWVHEACRAIRKLRDPSYLAQIVPPVMIVTAGRDFLVDNRQALKILPVLRAEYRHFRGACHEMLMEADSIRRPLLTIVTDFFRRHAPQLT